MPQKKYKNLGQGSEKLKNNLSRFIVQDATKGQEGGPYNPLKDARKPRVKADTPVETLDKVEKADEKQEVKVNKSVDLLVDDTPATTAPKKTTSTVKTTVVKKAATPSTGIKKPAQKQVKKEEKPNSNLPEDFRSHSCIFSQGQLNRLRDAVFLKKATEDRKYSIKDALFEAFNQLLENREPLREYPDDFITYSPLVSTRQFEELYSFVYNIKAREDSKYAMKYAIYEAIEIYLLRLSKP